MKCDVNKQKCTSVFHKCMDGTDLLLELFILSQWTNCPERSAAAQAQQSESSFLSHKLGKFKAGKSGGSRCCFNNGDKSVCLEQHIQIADIALIFILSASP